MKEIARICRLETGGLYVRVDSSELTPSTWGLALADLARNIVADVFESGDHPPDATESECMAILVKFFIAEVIHHTSELDRRPDLHVVDELPSSPVEPREPPDLQAKFEEPCCLCNVLILKGEDCRYRDGLIAHVACDEIANAADPPPSPVEPPDSPESVTT